MIKLLAITTFLVNLSFAQILDDGLTPAERFETGQMMSGSFSASNVLMCSQSALKQKLDKPLLSDNTLLSLSPYLTVKDQLSLINELINSALDLMTRELDISVMGRHVCTGFYNELESHIGNALSYDRGYIIFDFKLIQNLYSQEVRSFWMLDFLVFHEFAHQLQYWNNDLELIKTRQGLQNSRKIELAADCVAGALLGLKYRNRYTPEDYSSTFSGLVGASKLLGDYNKNHPSHHGTPLERIMAIRYGSDLSKGSSNLSSEQNHNSTYLFSKCYDFIESLDSF